MAQLTWGVARWRLLRRVSRPWLAFSMQQGAGESYVAEDKRDENHDEDRSRAHACALSAVHSMSGERAPRSLDRLERDRFTQLHHAGHDPLFGAPTHICAK